ncbi:MAG: acyloxyacyl hydrolase, partial [Bacteroidota bacterium]
MKKRIHITLFLFSFPVFLFSQTDSVAGKFFIQPDLMVGKVAPNYTNGFPKTSFYRGMALNFGWQADGKKHWHKHYNFPKTGIAVSFCQPGNDTVFGNNINVYPYITINTAKKRDRIFDFKFGLGASYYTLHYDSLTNPENEDIGSHFTWFFYAFINKQWKLNDHNELYLGAGFMHSSNGHTQLPNYGLNMAVANIGIQHFFSYYRPDQRVLTDIATNKMKYYKYYKDFKWGIWLRSGLGFHERGNTTGPVGGKKYAVYSQAVGATLTYNHFTRFRGGFTYKFYDSYYDYILNDTVTYEHPKREASALTLFLGTEFLIGRIAIDLEGALHLYRPFYYKFFHTYEKESDFEYFLKNLFVTKVGLNAYLFK